MNDPELVYNFGGIDTIIASIQTFVADMQANLDDVDKTFGNLLASGWHGAGADRFAEQSAKWHGAANDLATALFSLGQKAGNAAANMQAADQAAAARLG
jgi:WXG100 family type VII secretion target